MTGEKAPKHGSLLPCQLEIGYLQFERGCLKSRYACLKKQLVDSKSYEKSKNSGAGGYPCIAISAFRSIAAFLSKLWAIESHPTSRLTLGRPRSRKRLNPRLFLSCPNILSDSIIRRTGSAYPSSLLSFSRACCSRLPCAFHTTWLQRTLFAAFTSVVALPYLITTFKNLLKVG